MNSKSCATEFSGEEYEVYTQVGYLGCSTSDFSSSSQGMFEITGAWYGSDFACESAEIFMQSSGETRITADDSVKYSSNNYIMDNNFEPCSVRFAAGGEKEFLEECIEQSGVTSTVNDVWEGHFQLKYTYSVGLTIPAETASDQWFENGTVVYEYRNWIVTITYTDSATAPTFSAVTTDGSDTASGTMSFN